MATAEDLLCNAEAERSVLGSLVIDPSALSRVQGALQAGDFWVERHQWIYQAMLDMHLDATPVDFVTLCDRLEVAGRLEAAGGPAYVTELVNVVPSSIHVEHYAAIVARLATSRRLVAVATRIAELAHDQGQEIDNVFAQARALIDSVAPLDLGRAVLYWKESLHWYLESQEERLLEVEAERSGEEIGRLRFPWTTLQGRVRWIRPGMVILVGAESGVGKTMFMECCAEHWARQGFRVVFFHFELGHQTMLDRRMCRQAGLRMAELEDGAMDDRVTRALAEMYQWSGGVHYVHCPGWPMVRVVGTARQLAAKGECDVLVVDYLQKAFLPTKAMGLTPAQVRGQQVEMLKVLAEQLGIPVLLASQLNRTSQQFGRKSRFSIRDTGEADEKSNVVLLLDREVLDRPLALEYAWDEHQMIEVSAKAGEFSLLMKVRTDKNTLGPTGDDELMLDPSRFWVMDKVAATQKPVGWEERAAELEPL